MPRRLVLVSGAPGAGKSTLARPLAASLGFPLLCKDRIKETLHDELGAPEPDLAWSRWLGGAAMGLLWALAADAPDIVLEANFRPHSDYELGKIAELSDLDGGGGVALGGLGGPGGVAFGGLGGPGDSGGVGCRVVEVYCKCPAEVAAARYAERAASCHPVHVVTCVSLEFLAQFDQPLGVGELIVVDTTVPVDVPAISREVRARLAPTPPPSPADPPSEPTKSPQFS